MSSSLDPFSCAFLPLVIVGYAVGLLPPVGPGRAAWIALRSRFARTPQPESLRLSETKLLKLCIADKDFGQGYLVVTGETGLGKTCLVRTATSKTPGVISVSAHSGHTERDIIDNVLRQLTRMNYGPVYPSPGAKRVIFWHRVLTLGRSPVVVIKVTERQAGEKHALLTHAVRTLVETYKLRVIVEGEPDSIETRLLRTKREQVFEIEPMTKEMIWRMDQHQELFKIIKEAGLDETVFAVLGGFPSSYDALWDKITFDLQNGKDAREAIGSHLCAKIFAAIGIIQRSYGSIATLVKVFNQADIFTEATLVANGLKRPEFGDIFRRVKLNGVHALAPTSNAIGIVLRHDIRMEPSLDELELLLKTSR